MTFRLSLVALGLVGWLTASTVAADQVEVLGRGPVHEAYAEPSEREPKPTPIISKEPPKQIEELPPDQKPAGDNVQWMPGYWSWDEEKKDFLWVSGFWRNVPPGRSWVPGSWRKSGDGWQWTGGFWAEAKGGKAGIEYLPQPPAPLDSGGPTTPAPSETHFYVPGTWVYRERYVWRPGFWCEYQPGWTWCAAHYRWSPAGYVFIDGYWDYPLADRGCLFAPVYIPPAIYTAPAYVYTPTVIVREDCLYGAFFARRGFGCYYFGDYFTPYYASLGFSAWCGGFGLSISFGGGGWYDPLFAYYRCGYRHDPFWGHGCVDLYAGRYHGDYLRPPQTLVQQNTVINNITNVNNNVNTNNVTMLTSLNQARQKNLQMLTESDRLQQQNTIRSAKELAARRADTETQLATRPGAGGKTGAPTSVTLDVPQQPTPKGKGPMAGLGTAATPGSTTASSPTPPPPPRPTPLGPAGLKPGATSGSAIQASPGGKPPLTSRPGLGVLSDPKPSVTKPLPKGDLPAAKPATTVPKVDVPGAKPAITLPKADLPAAKPATTLPQRSAPAAADLPAPKPAVPINPTPSTVKPPVSAPPASIPKPPASAPVIPRAPPVSVSPPVNSRPTPSAAPLAAGPQAVSPGPAPAMSRPAAVPSRPAPPPAKSSQPKLNKKK
ncbi:MAG TPA: hypothetical protein VKD71_00250 [Gemmataceae bacterium]|nr:hypothetical protein [Gemmataceae bacterium]